MRKPTRERYSRRSIPPSSTSSTAVVVGQLLVDHQVAGDHGQPCGRAAAGRAGRRWCRCRAARTAPSSTISAAARRYGVLLGHAHLGDLGEGLVALLDDGAAVHPGEQSLLLQLQQVAPDGGGG